MFDDLSSGSTKPGAVPSAESLMAVDVSSLDDVSALELVHTVSTLQAMLEAVRMQAIERLSVTMGRDEWTQDLLAGELKLSMYRAGEDLHAAHALTTRLPQTLAALRGGQLNPPRAAQIVKATGVLTDDQARAVEDELFPRVLDKSPSGVSTFVRRKVAAADPDAAQLRAAQAKADRAVTVDHGEDGVSWLNASLPNEDVTAIYGLLDSLAREVKRAGDTRTMDQLRADVLRDIVLGKLSSRVQTHIYVTVDAATLAALNNQPGQLRGAGLIPAATVRELASKANTTWTLAQVDRNGQLCRLSEPGYLPSPQLTEFIQVRDQTCRFPACTKPAHKCDREHLVPYHKGGHTCERNCHCLCRRHHRLKQSAQWKVTRGTHGELIWTTPQKRRLVSKVEPLTTKTSIPDRTEPPPF